MVRIELDKRNGNGFLMIWGGLIRQKYSYEQLLVEIVSKQQIDRDEIHDAIS